MSSRHSLQHKKKKWVRTVEQKIIQRFLITLDAVINVKLDAFNP